MKTLCTDKEVSVDYMKIKSTHLETLLDNLGRQFTNLKTLCTDKEVSVDNKKIQSTYLEALLTYLKRHFIYLEVLLPYLGAMYRQIKINNLHLQFQILGLTNINQHHSHFAKPTRLRYNANFANRLFSAKHQQQ